MRRLVETKLVLATHNAGKLTEFRTLVAPFGIEVVSAGELGLPEPEETGTTFEENAATKALAAAKATGLVALSDDSGLEVDALGNQPGVYTADWATLQDGSRSFTVAMQKVENALIEVGATLPGQRKGRFVATLCLAWPDGDMQYFRGEATGQLVWPPRGNDGFGYDPVFLPDGHARTFGEMTAHEKHGWKPGDAKALSHRARAFKLFAQTHLMLGTRTLENE
jgi:XTP/dITP diphosphohydrolase